MSTNLMPASSSAATRIGLNCVLLFGTVLALYMSRTVLIPIVIALLLAAALGPAAYWLYRSLKIRWSIACLVVIFGLVFMNVLLTLVFFLAGARLVNQLPNPKDEERTLKIYKESREKLAQVSPVELDEVLLPRNPESVKDIQAFQNLSEYAPTIFREVVFTVFTFSWQWVLILFILIFMLLEGRTLAARVVEIFGPSDEVQHQARAVLDDMARQVRNYLVWRTIINFGLAILMGIVYQTAGLSQAWTWAILLAILNYIPYLGAIMAGIPPVMDAFVSTSGMGAVVVLCFYVVIVVIEGYLIVPLLMGRGMEMNALTVMVACLFWELVWGVPGLFLAMPLMAAIKSILHHVPEWRPWANLMATAAEEPKPVILRASSPGGAASGTVPAVVESKSTM